MDAITFRFLISLAVSEELDMRLTDVITAYLYGSIDSDIHMKSLKDLNCMKQLVQNLVACFQLSYKDLYMD